MFSELPHLIQLDLNDEKVWIKSHLDFVSMPKLYNLYRDQQEWENVFFSDTWVPKVALAKLTEHVTSLQKEPPIKTGTLDPYTPPQK